MKIDTINHSFRLPAGKKRIIHVLNKVINENLGDGGNRPTICIWDGDNKLVVNEATIEGESTFRFSSQSPVPTGPKVWVETHAAVLVTEIVPLKEGE